MLEISVGRVLVIDERLYAWYSGAGIATSTAHPAARILSRPFLNRRRWSFVNCCVVSLGAAVGWPASAINAAQLISKYEPDPTIANQQYSFGEALATDGATHVISSPGTGVFVFDASTDEERFSHIPTTLGLEFGASVAVRGSTMAVGVSRDDFPGFLSTHSNAYPTEESGSVLLLDSYTGLERAKLYASDPGNKDQFGASVAIGPAGVLVGAPLHDGHKANSGAAYLFDPVGGRELMRITPEEERDHGWFGAALAMDGDYAVIGAPGGVKPGESAYGKAFLYQISSGEKIADLIPTGIHNSSHNFGISVAINNGIVAVGAPDSYGGGVYLYDASPGASIGGIRNNGRVSIGGGPDDYVGDTYGNSFGRAVGLSENQLLVGAPFDGTMGFFSLPEGLAGLVYLYDLPSLEPAGVLFPDDGKNFGRFGATIAVSKEVALIRRSDELASFAGDQGSAYSFRLVPEPSSLVFVCTSVCVLLFGRR